MKSFTSVALLACSIGLPAMTAARAASHVDSHTSSHQTSLHVDEHALDWRSDSRSLRLRAGPNGVKVLSVTPDGWLGLQCNDLVLAIDERKVTTIPGFRRVLGEIGTRAAPLTVRTADGGHRKVTLARDDYAPWLPYAPEPSPPPRVTTTR